jgi:hypothetical protein
MANELETFPWTEILDAPARSELIEEIIFTAGVTTLVARSGGGKTTLAHAVNMTVGSGGLFGGKQIEQRESNWIAGEGQYGMQPLYRAWLQEHPGCPTPPGWWTKEPVNFHSATETDKLLRRLDNKPPVLIVADALGQMLGGNDEDKAQHINAVYANVWRVVNTNGAAFMNWTQFRVHEIQFGPSLDLGPGFGSKDQWKQRRRV